MPPADETRCTVILSFDLDGPSGMIRRNPNVERMPSARSMGEFGPDVAAPRILDLLREYGLPSSWYIPGWIAERWPAVVARVAGEGHEVGHHGYLHEPPASLTPEEEAEVLDRGSAILERVADARPLGYRSPAWELSEHSLRFLADRGFVYDSSLMGKDVPYTVDAGEGRSLVEIPVHWALDDFPYFAFNPATDIRNVIASPAQVYDAWSATFDEMYARGSLFVLTCHPWIIGRAGRLAMLERLIRHMRSCAGVRFARSIDVAREFAASAGSAGSR